MAVKQYKPTSPGRRGATGYTFEEITRKKPEKSLVYGKKQNAGRNNRGRITVRHRGGGHKRRYRIIDFKRDKLGIPAKVASVEYDPNRTARIALLHYVDGEKRYIIWPAGLKVGDTVVSGPEAEIKTGNALPLRNIPSGTIVHNLELHKGKGAQLVRGAGTKRPTRSSGYRPARSAASSPTAWRRSARWETQSTARSSSAAPAAGGLWVAGPTSGALP